MQKWKKKKKRKPKKGRPNKALYKIRINLVKLNEINSHFGENMGARACSLGRFHQIWFDFLSFFLDLLVLAKKKRRKGERKVQKVQVRATVEIGGEAIFGLYLFLKGKEEVKL